MNGANYKMLHTQIIVDALELVLQKERGKRKRKTELKKLLKLKKG